MLFARETWLDKIVTNIDLCTLVKRDITEDY